MATVKSITTSVTAPQIISQNLFPYVYAADIPDMIIDERSEIYPGVYSYYGLPNVLTSSIDPKYVTGPQKYEYRYTNQNGVDVVVRGTYNNVMSAIDVLNTYPPLLRDCDKTGDKEYFELYGPGSGPGNGASKSTNVPTVGVQDRGSYILVKMNNKTYSGSGSLIMVVENNQPLTSAKFVLFRDAKTGQYEDLGGKIDKPSSGVNIDKDILFTNAKKESTEESMRLIELTKESPSFVDIESTSDNTYYRIYVYMFVMTNISQLPALYDANKGQVIVNFPNNYTAADRETNRIGLFDYQTFIKKLGSYSVPRYDVAEGTFQMTSGTMEKVNGRAMKAIAQLTTDNILNDMISNKKLSVASIITPGGTILFNTVTLS